MTPEGPSIVYTTFMELGPQRPSLLWFWELNSIVVVYMDPLGTLQKPTLSLNP